jgi:PiT family inorganic phosphate transporter
MIWFFLASGLFLGWSLGANDAANVFGTAVGTRMVKFRTAAIITCLFVALGAVISGAGATHTLGKLGAVNALAGSFTVALAAGATVAWMTRVGLPVSTSQAIVGAIVGWNLFTGSPTEMTTLTTIVATWIICPVLAAILAFLMFKFVRLFLYRLKVHMLRQDAYNRFGLLLVGAFGAYSLGANNIANVMGVFVESTPFRDITPIAGFTFSGTQSLFLLGAVAIGIGVVTYSKRVMLTVGGDLLRITPVAALIVVLSHSLVLFLFASQGLEAWLAGHGLPTIPLVPVSSSQAVVGAVVGIGFARGGKGLNFSVLRRIASGWVTTPVAAGLLAFLSLFFVQNVFEMEVVRPAVAEVTIDAGTPSTREFAGWHYLPAQHELRLAR